MNYSTIYVGMDVHKESFTVCCYTNEKEKAEYCQTIDAHYSKILNYIEAMKLHLWCACSLVLKELREIILSTELSLCYIFDITGLYNRDKRIRLKGDVDHED